jgi:hypothetical protein
MTRDGIENKSSTIHRNHYVAVFTFTALMLFNQLPIVVPVGFWLCVGTPMSHGNGSPRKGMSPTANTRGTRERMIASSTKTWLIPEDV